MKDVDTPRELSDPAVKPADTYYCLYVVESETTPFVGCPYCTQDHRDNWVCRKYLQYLTHESLDDIPDGISLRVVRLHQCRWEN
jgi:hypothetical protein